jgi:hypothetical protein
MTVCNWLRPSPSLADGGHRAGQSGRRPYNRPASRLAVWPVIIRAGRPHEHATILARRCAGDALGAAKVNSERAGNPHQLRHGPVADGAQGGHSPFSLKRNRVDTHPARRSSARCRNFLLVVGRYSNLRQGSLISRRTAKLADQTQWVVCGLHIVTSTLAPRS